MSHGSLASWFLVGAVVLAILMYTGILGFILGVLKFLFFATIIGAAIFGYLHFRGGRSVPE